MYVDSTLYGRWPSEIQEFANFMNYLKEIDNLLRPILRTFLHSISIVLLQVSTSLSFHWLDEEEN